MGGLAVRVHGIPWPKEKIASFNATLVATGHSNVNYEQPASWSPLIIDTRNATQGLEAIDRVVTS